MASLNDNAIIARIEKVLLGKLFFFKLKKEKDRHKYIYYEYYRFFARKVALI